MSQRGQHTKPRRGPKKGSKGPKRINGSLLDVATAAGLLGITERTLRARVARKQVPFRHWGGRVVFVRHELERWIDTLEGCSVAEALERFS